MDDAKNLPQQSPAVGVVAGTLITMADGSTKPVERLAPGDEVRSGDSADTVAIVRKGMAPVVTRIKTSGGHSLACSSDQNLLKAGWGGARKC